MTTHEFEAALMAAADRLEPDLIEALLQAFSEMVDSVDANTITRLVDAGDIHGAVAVLGAALIAKALAPAAALRVTAFVEGKTLGAASIQFTLFGPRHLSAEAVAARQAAEMVTNISVETKLALRSAVLGAIREGGRRADLERTIRGLVGLNTQQTAATLAYRQSLVDAGFTRDRVNILSDRYTTKKLRERAHTIARFEIMDAMNSGTRESWLQAQADGWLGPAARKEWISSAGGPKPACQKCAAMNGVNVPLREMFQYDGERIAGPPAHPRCRCCAAVVP